MFILGWLIGKGVVDFLLVLIELFLLGATAVALGANITWKSAFSLLRYQFSPKFQVEGVAPTSHSSSHKTRLNDLSRGVRMRGFVGTTFFRFVTNHAFDRQTNRQTDTFLIASPRWHSMQRGNKCVPNWLLKTVVMDRHVEFLFTD